MKRNLDIANEIALEAFEEQHDRYAASVPTGKRGESDDENNDTVQ